MPATTTKPRQGNHPPAPHQGRLEGRNPSREKPRTGTQKPERTQGTETGEILSKDAPTLKGLALNRLTQTLTPLLPRTNPGELKKPILQNIRLQTGGWERKPGQTPEEKWLEKIGIHNKQLYAQRGLDKEELKNLISNASLIRYSDKCSLTFEDKIRIRESTLIETAWSWRFSKEESHAEDEGREFDPNYRVFGKITSSFWRYEHTSDWNTAVAVFNNIRNFRIPGLPKAETTLDWSIGCNEKGYCAYNRNLFSDGPLAFLIHLNGEHVMTIGFTVMTKKTICINQIQMVKKKGNRFLFKFDRKKEILRAFFQTFPGFKIYLITGESASNEIYSSLERSMQEKETCLEHASTKKEKDRIHIRYQLLTDKLASYNETIKPKLLAFYPDNQGETKTWKNLTFRRIRKEDLGSARKGKTD